MKIKETRGDRIFNAFVIFLVVLCMVICLYPLYLVVINSFSDPALVARGKVFALPQGFTLDSYIEVFKNDDILIGYRNSIFYTVVGTIINLVLTIPAAYALSKKRLMGGNIVMMMIVFTMYFNGGLVPTFLVFKGLGLINTWGAVLMSGAVTATNLIVARSFFVSGVPTELEEAAEIDGASTLTTFVKVVLPLSKAMICVIMLYYAVARWNNYASALYYLPMAPEKYPLQMVLRQILIVAQQLTSFDSDPEMALYYANLANQIKYAVIVVASVPLLVVYPFVQKYFEKGVMLGSVKG